MKQISSSTSFFMLPNIPGQTSSELRIPAADRAWAKLSPSRAGLAQEFSLKRPAPLRETSRRRLPWPAASFDLVVSTTSFDHWADQWAGLAYCARVLTPGGCLVLADLFSVLPLPTLLAGRRGKARTKRRATQPVTAAGIALAAVAPPLRRHYLRSDGYQIATAYP